ncbi:hypothetical protein J5N97_013990 [Dioscorea zingiberensis]|uniref:Protein EXORDIUM-like 2 n=1 Tax=Dioscorea zingiberensis TaxID=325984 RepID=A0A9D5CRJ2_9LILI|nr:hypothetical protein J5N97_013990 [Dioscorea zingiberensis]
MPLISFFFSLSLLLPLSLCMMNNSMSSTQFQYHNGPLLTSPINIYLTWYGSFSPTHKSAISSFFSSFSHPALPPLHPTVSHWWSTTQAYKDLAGKPATKTINLAGKQYSDVACSLGKSLTHSDLITLVKKAITRGSLPLDSNGVYFVLTAADITVEKFCMDSCGFHNNVELVPGRKVVVAHVGDPAMQCPGTCAWPYAKPAYGPPGPALVAPNGVGVDGMVMNLATVMAGAVTNRAGDGWYQGDRLAPLEAVTACPGIFGAGAYPGYPGELLMDRRSKVSFNVYGAGGRKFLLPAIWDLVTGTCKAAA